jgi:thiamine biosynthesis protein ThiS
VLNGQPRDFPQLPPAATLQDLIADLALKGDRVAVEHNGNIVPRADWVNTALAEGDRLEIVHFVGGGCDGCPESGPFKPKNCLTRISFTRSI